jgi:hypothetical protein
MRFPVVIFAAVLLALPPSTFAQQIARDEASGDYLLTYTDLYGDTYTVRVEAADKIDPQLDVQITASEGALVYRYLLTNKVSSMARSPVFWLQIPCPMGESDVTVSAPAPWFALVAALEGAQYCHYSPGTFNFTPGTTLEGLELSTVWLPTVVDVRVVGAANRPLWPSEEGMVPGAVYDLADQVQGYTGGWVTLPAVGPGYPPEALADPAEGLGLVRSDLARACELEWISPRGVCNSLEQKLENASRALDRGQPNAARGELGALVAELDAQRGKHVNENAYWLLKTNAEYVLARISQ